MRRDMISASFIENTQNHDSNLPVIDICKVNKLGAPEYSVLVKKNDIPTVKLQVYLFDETDCFKSIICNDETVVIGCGEKVHFYSIGSNLVKTIKLNDYFGYLYSDKGIEENNFKHHLYIASGLKLYKYKADGAKVWESDYLAVDGVILGNIDSGVIVCRGEQDPPGGWVEYKLDESTGKII